MTVDDKFKITHRGKEGYVLYAGFLDAAHADGLKSIDEELIQKPNSENGNVAIMKATVVTDKGTFVGHGEASTSERGPAKEAPIRMSSTRAKRRALSDAVNAGNESEEPGEEDAWREAERQAKDNQERHLKEVPKDIPKGAKVIGENGAEQLYRHMLEHGWNSSKVNEYEESHGALAELTDEEGRQLWKAVKAGVKA